MGATLNCDVCGLPVEAATYVRRVLCATCLDCGFVTEAKLDVATADEKCDGCDGLFPRAQLKDHPASDDNGERPVRFCVVCTGVRKQAEREWDRVIDATIVKLPPGTKKSDGGITLANYEDVVQLRARIAALELLVLRLVQHVDREAHKASGRKLSRDLLTPDERKLLREEPR